MSDTIITSSTDISAACIDQDGANDTFSVTAPANTAVVVIYDCIEVNQGHFILDASASGSSIEMRRADKPILSLAHQDHVGLDVDELGGGVLLGGTSDYTMTGRPKTEYLQVDIVAGNNYATIRAGSPTGWGTGDVLRVADTHELSNAEHINYVSRAENFTFQGTSNGGTRITLDRAATYNHAGVLLIDGSTVYPSLSNLTRAIKFTSVNEDPAALRRGHLMFHQNVSGTASYVRTTGMGRTRLFGPDNKVLKFDVHNTIDPTLSNQKGRYPWHYHLCTQVQTSVGLVVDNGLKWGMVVHGTSWGSHTRPIVTGVHGCGIVTEAGNEVHNTFTEPLVQGKIRGEGGDYSAGTMTNESTPDHWATDGSGISEHGVNNWIDFRVEGIENKGAGAGITFYRLNALLLNAQTAANSANTKQIDVRKVGDNPVGAGAVTVRGLVFGATDRGVETWGVGAAKKGTAALSNAAATNFGAIKCVNIKGAGWRPYAAGTNVVADLQIVGTVLGGIGIAGGTPAHHYRSQFNNLKIKKRDVAVQPATWGTMQIDGLDPTGCSTVFQFSTAQGNQSPPGIDSLFIAKGVVWPVGGWTRNHQPIKYSLGGSNQANPCNYIARSRIYIQWLMPDTSLVWWKWYRKEQLSTYIVKASIDRDYIGLDPVFGAHDNAWADAHRADTAISAIAGVGTVSPHPMFDEMFLIGDVLPVPKFGTDPEGSNGYYEVIDVGDVPTF